jgi:hypothetical protein
MSTKDPKKIHIQPPYSGKKQPAPGSEEEMTPQADHGESSYKGTGRLARLPSLSREREPMLPSPIYPKRRTPGRLNVLLPKPVAKPSFCLATLANAYPRLWLGKQSMRWAQSTSVNNAAFQRTCENSRIFPMTSL